MGNEETKPFEERPDYTGRLTIEIEDQSFKVHPGLVGADNITRTIFGLADAKGYSMSRLEKLTGITRKTFLDWKKGDGKTMPSLANAVAVLNAMGFDLVPVETMTSSHYDASDKMRPFGWEPLNPDDEKPDDHYRNVGGSSPNSRPIKVQTPGQWFADYTKSLPPEKLELVLRDTEELLEAYRNR